MHPRSLDVRKREGQAKVRFAFDYLVQCRSGGSTTGTRGFANFPESISEFPFDLIFFPVGGYFCFDWLVLVSFPGA